MNMCDCGAGTRRLNGQIRDFARRHRHRPVLAGRFGRSGQGARNDDWSRHGTPLHPPVGRVTILAWPPNIQPAIAVELSAMTPNHVQEPRTLFDKLWDSHAIAPARTARRSSSSTATSSTRARTTPSPAAERAGAGRRPDLTFGVADHYVPTRGRGQVTPARDRRDGEHLQRNTAANGIGCSASAIRGRASSTWSARSRD